MRAPSKPSFYKNFVALLFYHGSTGSNSIDLCSVKLSYSTLDYQGRCHFEYAGSNIRANVTLNPGMRRHNFSNTSMFDIRR